MRIHIPGTRWTLSVYRPSRPPYLQPCRHCPHLRTDHMLFELLCFRCAVKHTFAPRRWYHRGGHA